MRNAVDDRLTDIEDVYRPAPVMGAQSQAVVLPSDDSLEGFAPLRDGLHSLLVVHLHTEVLIGLIFFPYLTHIEGVLKRRTFDALPGDSPVLKIVSTVRFQLSQVKMQFIGCD